MRARVVVSFEFMTFTYRLEIVTKIRVFAICVEDFCIKTVEFEEKFGDMTARTTRFVFHWLDKQNNVLPFIFFELFLDAVFRTLESNYARYITKIYGG